MKIKVTGYDYTEDPHQPTQTTWVIEADSPAAAAKIVTGTAVPTAVTMSLNALQTVRQSALCHPDWTTADHVGYLDAEYFATDDWREELHVTVAGVDYGYGFPTGGPWGYESPEAVIEDVVRFTAKQPRP